MRNLRPTFRGAALFLRNISIVLCLVVLAGANGAGQDRPRFEHPVMMDSDGPGNELYVLVDGAILHKFRVGEKSLSEYGSVAFPAGFKPADMTYARTEKPASILFAGSQSGRGKVLLYSLDGRTLKEWGFQNVCSGVDSGKAGHHAYVATSDSNDLYQLDMQAIRMTLVAHIDSAAKLGPVAFDEKHQLIYVADIAAGKIFQYSLQSRKSALYVSGLSAPSALAFDPDTDRLFVADPGQRSVFTIDVRATKPAIKLFASDPLRSPYGLTLIAKGRVAVADYNANAVYVFSGKGEVLFRYPAGP